MLETFALREYLSEMLKLCRAKYDVKGSRSIRIVHFVVAAIICFLGWNHLVAEDLTNFQSSGNVTLKRLLEADTEPGEWLTGGRDYQQTYYSPLTNINKTNVKQLGYSWSYNIEFTTAFEATPIVVDGVMYTSGNRGKVYSLDAKTGKLIWKFDPDIDLTVLSQLCCTDVNRGVVVWRGNVYVGSLDGYLYALDASTGAVLWKVDTIIDRARAYSITGVPYIAKNQVVIGNSGAEFDARGYVTAYDTETGKQAWRFYTVPGDPKNGFEHPELKWASKTWDPDSRWDMGLGGTVWDGMAYDPELNLLYVGTGNGAPWNRNIRSPAGGDNLFLSSILALNPDNGRLIWHYQTTPGDTWDYTAAQKLVLADLEIGKNIRQVIMQAPKNGFFYILDRKSGELLSAEPYARINWASHVDMKTGRPVETEQGDYSKEPKLVLPGPLGAHSWAPMSYNKKTALVYIPVMDIPLVLSAQEQNFSYERGQSNLGVTVTGFTAGGWLSQNAAPNLPTLDSLTADLSDLQPRLFLTAWDPVIGRAVWRNDITGEIDPSLEFYRRAGGVMTTASGLVFQGGADGFLRIYDANNGSSLHSINVGTSMLAAAMTYLIGGEQYVAIMAGVGDYDGYVDQLYGKKGRIVAFKLGEGEVPQRKPTQLTKTKIKAPTVKDDGTTEQISHGEALFRGHCAACHSTGRAPDLTRISEPTRAEFPDIVLKGIRASRGMGNFSALLSVEDARDILAYINHLTWLKFQRQDAEGAVQ